MYFLECVKYVIFIGISGFVFGLILPKDFLKASKFPFKSFGFEENGKFYEKLKIKKWKNKLPDMSKIFPWLLTEKSITGKTQSKESLKDSFSLLIKETCMAEFIHILLCIAGFRCIKIWSGIGGIICCLLNILGNLPFIIIQRYNRPRLISIVDKIIGEQQETDELCLCHASASAKGTRI